MQHIAAERVPTPALSKKRSTCSSKGRKCHSVNDTRCRFSHGQILHANRRTNIFVFVYATQEHCFLLRFGGFHPLMRPSQQSGLRHIINSSGVPGMLRGFTQPSPHPQSLAPSRMPDDQYLPFYIPRPLAILWTISARYGTPEGWPWRRN
jgi:hypothetical protein